MNHGFKLHPDGTLEITMPKGEKVGRVFVCEEGTQNGALYYSDGLMEQYKWERDIAISQLKDLGYEFGEKPRKSDVGDMISRQEILRAFEEMCSCTDYGWDERDFRDLIKNMPSAQPERKTGKWIHKKNIYGAVYCSECDYELYANDTNFCPNCGSYNGGEQE